MSTSRCSFALALTSVATVLVAGCGSTSMMLTGAKQPSREPTCEFQVLTSSPGGQYLELGTIDVQPGAYASNTYTQLEAFKEKIQPYVCEAGGDAAIALSNGFGMYIKATILKHAGGAGTAAPSNQGGAQGGCQFDTQCKGDRVCVKGECVEPAKK